MAPPPPRRRVHCAGNYTADKAPRRRHGDGSPVACVCSGLVEDMTPAEISLRIDALRREHRALDEQIQRTPANLDDELQAKRLKKRKLQLKDCIMRLENLLIPDEPA